MEERQKNYKVGNDAIKKRKRGVKRQKEDEKGCWKGKEGR